MSISPSDKIKVAIDGNIATVIIDNPAANTWDRESLPALKAVIEALNADLSVYALVLTGAGEKFFSAGADLNQFASGDADVARAVGEAFGEAFETLADFAAYRSLRLMGSPWAAVSRWRWPVISGLPKSRPHWHCRRLAWACCPAPVARNA